MSFDPWEPGELVTDDRLESISAKPAAYTPEWSAASGTAPSYGASTIRAYYYRVGRLIHFNVHIVFASGVNFGSGGSWIFGLPVPMSATQARANIDIQAYDASAAAFRAGRALASQAQPAGQEIHIIYTDGVAVWSSGQPFTWAAGDEIFMSGTYEAA